MLSRADIALQIVLVSHRLYEKGFVTATDGNVSARLANGNILCTPTSLNKGLVSERDLVEVMRDGTPVTLNRKASTELDMHLFIYRERPDVHAVVHAHPKTATGFAAARLPLPDRILPEVIVGLGTIPLAQYATPSTNEVADSLAPFVKSCSAVLLANHGVVTYGADLEEAYFKMEKVEHAAQIALVAKLLGGPVSLTAGEIDRLRSVSQDSYRQDSAPERPAAPSSEESAMNEQTVKRMIRDILAQAEQEKGGPHRRG